MRILCIDAGSSSIKFACYDRDSANERAVYSGAAETKGEGAAAGLWRAVEEHDPPDAIAHRIVFGGPGCNAPVRLSDAILNGLRELRAWDPLHLGVEVAIVEDALRRFALLPQVLCFDTAFFRGLPDVATRLPLPRTLPASLRRYGFHGLSYEWALASLGHPRGRTVLAHLGSGASLCAVRDDEPVDTTMGYSVLGGVMMATRPGDLDPGVMLALLAQGYTAAHLSKMLYEESGLKGVSGFSGDMRELLAARATDPQAAEGVALFVHQLRKHLGAMVAVLGGIDTLVFTGGIGEHAPVIREEACAPFGYLGMLLDDSANTRGDPTISAARSSVVVRIVRANENAMIARHAWSLLT
ncbi:MAG TPA: acetate/propionate family kinase [Candidatus Dormibacteraeota bacterium]|nr:acetate/propionate family kinase [Candidatus Dormibacteraeota bacterium]